MIYATGAVTARAATIPVLNARTFHAITVPLPMPVSYRTQIAVGREVSVLILLWCVEGTNAPPAFIRYRVLH